MAGSGTAGIAESCPPRLTVPTPASEGAAWRLMVWPKSATMLPTDEDGSTAASVDRLAAELAFSLPRSPAAKDTAELPPARAMASAL
jgi:hypothetical protein